MKHVSRIMYHEAGQTLIETIVGIFLLATGLTTGLSLAIYALSTSTTSFNQITATNLAREGIEAARLMRDSNWLAGDAAGGAYDLQSCNAAPLLGKLCYPLAFNGPTFNMNPQNNATIETGIFYEVPTRLFGFTQGFDLYLQADGSFNQIANGANPIFSRKLKLSYITDGNYSPQYPELAVQSIVGWRGKNCTAMINSDPETTNCKVIVEEHLTNWKDYK